MKIYPQWSLFSKQVTHYHFNYSTKYSQRYENWRTLHISNFKMFQWSAKHDSELFFLALNYFFTVILNVYWLTKGYDSCLVNADRDSDTPHDL